MEASAQQVRPACSVAEQVVANLTGEGLASNVVYKEMFLTLRDTQHLHSEQKVRPPQPPPRTQARLVGAAYNSKQSGRASVIVRCASHPAHPNSLPQVCCSDTAAFAVRG